MKKSELWVIGALLIAAALLVGGCENPSGPGGGNSIGKQAATEQKEAEAWASIKAWQEFDSLAAMSDYLRTTPVNTPQTPYGIKLGSGVNVADFTSDPKNLNTRSDKMDRLFAAFQGNYVALDLTACAGTEIPDMTGAPGGPVRLEGDKLVLLKLPAGLKKLGRMAFGNCTSLVSVVVPDGLESLSGFYGCKSLLTVTLPESVQTIDYLSFGYCDSLVSAKLPEQMTSIGNNVFHGCVSLQSVTMPKQLNELGYNAFRDCAALTGLSVPEGVTTIEFGTFAGCANLNSLSLPASLAKIMVDDRHDNIMPFYGAVNVTFTVAPGNTLFEARENGKLLAYVGPTSPVYEEHGFNSVDSSYNMPTNTIVVAASLAGDITLSGYRAVQGNAFAGNTKIRSVKFAGGLEAVGSGVFDGCANLASLDFPSTVTYLTDIVSSVGNNPGLESLYFRMDAVIGWNMMFPMSKDVPNLTIYVPAHRLEAYVTDAGWAGGIYMGEPRGPYWGTYNIQPIPGT